MKSKTKNFFGYIFILLIIFLLGVSFTLVFSLIGEKVESQFGPATQDLDQSQQFLYKMRLFFEMDQLGSFRIPEETDLFFTIDEGESPASIAARLKDKHLIADAASFLDLLVYSGLDRLIQPGNYRIESEVTTYALAKMLVDPNPQFVAFSFLAGWRWEEIANLLPESGLEINAEDFKHTIQNSKAPFQNQNEAEVLGGEGYLYPGDYLISRSATTKELVEDFIKKFIEVVPEDFLTEAKNQQLSPHETVILASIVQKEMILAEEAPLIASVFLNRLRDEIPLQSDPTVQYALGYDQVEKSWWKSQLTAEDLRIESPFNTYLRKGLPPTPICNPGLDAILAVIRPEKTNFLYFRAACDESGRHVFSETYEEHLEQACE